jgi:DNA-binding NarL/FixJ family response regulator
LVVVRSGRSRENRGICSDAYFSKNKEIFMTQQKKLRLLIADDHEVIRYGLKSLLAETDIKVVAEAATAQAAVKYAMENEVDVVLMDIRMPDGDGLSTLGRIKLDKPDLPILMMSAFDNPTYIARAVALGASGYLLKGCTRDELIKAITTAATGESLFTREELRRVSGALATPRLAADVEVALTQRENEILKQLATGLTNKEIAAKLNISYETVKEHVQHILRKIGVTDRTQAAVWAVRKELV